MEYRADQYARGIHQLDTFYEIPAQVECISIRLKPYDRRRGNVLRTYASKAVNFLARVESGWYEYDPTRPTHVAKVRHACQVTQLGITIPECIRARLVGPLTRIAAFDVAFSYDQQKEIERRFREVFEPAPEPGTIDHPTRPERIDPGAPEGRPAGYRVPRNAAGQFQNVQGVPPDGVQCAPVRREDGSLIYVPLDQLSAHVAISSTTGGEVRMVESTGTIQVAVPPESVLRRAYEPREGRRVAPEVSEAAEAPEAPEHLAAPESVFEDVEHDDPPPPPSTQDVPRPGEKKADGNGGKSKGGRSAEEKRKDDAARKRSSRAAAKKLKGADDDAGVSEDSSSGESPDE